MYPKEYLPINTNSAETMIIFIIKYLPTRPPQPLCAECSLVVACLEQHHHAIETPRSKIPLFSPSPSMASSKYFSHILLRSRARVLYSNLICSVLGFMKQEAYAHLYELEGAYMRQRLSMYIQSAIEGSLIDDFCLKIGV